MTHTFAVYPGSFDPITNGHIDIVLRGAEVFDRVVVLVAVNSEKKTLFTVDERMALIRKVFADHPKVEVDSFEGLLMEYLRVRDIRVVIRGLRAVSDFEYEFQMALMNRKIYPEAETFFLATRENYSYVSSRILKEVFALGGCVKDLAPPVVIEAMRNKFFERRQKRKESVG
ncbi:MAG: pantetheine-phosphate adenylyltransferase [Deferrisomatales bacterium]